MSSQVSNQIQPEKERTRMNYKTYCEYNFMFIVLYLDDTLMWALGFHIYFNIVNFWNMLLEQKIDFP